MAHSECLRMDEGKHGRRRCPQNHLMAIGHGHLAIVGEGVASEAEAVTCPSTLTNQTRMGTIIIAACPRCGTEIEFEPCELLPKVIPICDPCGEIQAEEFAQAGRIQRWTDTVNARLPEGYRVASREKVRDDYTSAFSWAPETKHGGIGLIGASGRGKSCAIAALVMGLQRPFLWWSGTEARDAAIDASMADRDREGCRQRWERSMRVPILVLDDISQSKMTEAWSSRLFDLLETRLSTNLPTFWTSQMELPDLRSKISRQNGGDTAQAEAISRRLSQHSLILRAH